jgi:hypothetical protein
VDGRKSGGRAYIWYEIMAPTRIGLQRQHLPLDAAAILAACWKRMFAAAANLPQGLAVAIAAAISLPH